MYNINRLIIGSTENHSTTYQRFKITNQNYTIKKDNKII